MRFVCFFGACLAASAALADQRITMVVDGLQEGDEVYCDITRGDDGQMATVLQYRTDLDRPSADPVPTTPERVAQFDAVVDAFGTPVIPLTAADGRFEAPYTFLTYTDPAGTGVPVAALVPGAALPAILRDLFGPFHAGACLLPGFKD